jgi:ATP-binding cassette subfamily C protein
MVAISGPSGAGKSTMLRILVGIEAPLQSLEALPTVAADSCDWISTDIYVPAGTLADAIAWNRSDIDRAAVVRAATRVGLLDESLLPGGLDAPIGEGGDNLSGGQRMRIGVARALLSDRIVFADEPTAKLDSVTAALVHEVLADIARLRLVVVATHDRRLIQMADRELRLHLRSPDCEAVAA